MSKRSIEVCVASARGLKRSNPLWKLRTLCLAWIDPEHKYRSQVDKSGDTHPTWNMRFSAIVDDDDDDDRRHDVLHVEVHSQEPVFLFAKLECAASIPLKEFLGKADAAPRGEWEEPATFQLRTPRGKARGMVDVVVRVSRLFDNSRVIESHGGSDVATTEGGENYGDDDDDEEDEEDDAEEEPVTAYPANVASRPPPGRPEDFPPPNYPYSLPPKTAPPGYSHPPPPAPPGYRYPPPAPPGYSYPPPAPPPGYSYPPSAPPLGGSNYFGLPGARPGNYGGGQRLPGAGLAAGALAGGAGGAMLLGLDGATIQNGIDDAISQFHHGGSLSIYSDPLF